MLLKKLNAIYEEIETSLTSKEKSVNPAPMKADANKSLTDEAPAYFNDLDETGKKVKGRVPKEYVEKYKRRAKKS